MPVHAQTPKSGRSVLISADNAAKYLSAYAQYIQG
jgi:hypothetical protein